MGIAVAVTAGYEELPIEELERVVRDASRALAKKYEARKGKTVAERWCLSCGAVRVSGPHQERADLEKSTCDGCWPSSKEGIPVDPVARLLAR